MQKAPKKQSTTTKQLKKTAGWKVPKIHSECQKEPNIQRSDNKLPKGAKKGFPKSQKSVCRPKR